MIGVMMIEELASDKFWKWISAPTILLRRV
jgi:hypothetical protein